jgi:hypothetical protein
MFVKSPPSMTRATGFGRAPPNHGNPPFAATARSEREISAETATAQIETRTNALHRM